MKRNLTLLTDYYELTMMNGFYLMGMKDKVAVFDLFFRNNLESNYCIAAGLEQAVEYINNLHFDKDDIEYLRSLKDFDEGFLQLLANFKFTGNIYAVEEGTVVFPGQPLMVVEAPIYQAQLLESALLCIINFQTLIATKADRITRIASPSQVLEFGLRRAQAPDAAIYGARAAIIGGCSSTSNVLAAQQFGLEAKGTHAHSWIMSFDSELDAFNAYAQIYPTGAMLLVDTYDTLRSGVPNAIKVFKQMRAKGQKPVGIRLDSGDLAYLSKQARIMLDNEGFNDVKIFASGDLDEYVISALRQQGAKIDVYGVGTRLITSYSNASLGGVYKMSAMIEDGKYIPKIKISDNAAKITNPSKKRLYRLLDNKTNMAIADVMTLWEETIDDTNPYTLTHPVDRWKKTTVDNYTAVELYKQIYKDGKQVYDLPNINQIRQHSIDSVGQFWEEYKRLEVPHLYKVDLSDKLYELKQDLLSKTTK